MPLILLVLSAVAGAIWWWVLSNPRDALHSAQDVVETVRNAPLKPAFRRQTQAHPVKGIDAVRIAICGIAQAFIELDDLPTREPREKLRLLLRTRLDADAAETEEMEVPGRWLIVQCNGAKAAIPRLARRACRIDAEAGFDSLTDLLADLVEAQPGAAQQDAIADIRLAFHLRA